VATPILSPVVLAARLVARELSGNFERLAVSVLCGRGVAARSANAASGHDRKHCLGQYCAGLDTCRSQYRGGLDLRSGQYRSGLDFRGGQLDLRGGRNLLRVVSRRDPKP